MSTLTGRCGVRSNVPIRRRNPSDSKFGSARNVSSHTNHGIFKRQTEAEPSGVIKFQARRRERFRMCYAVEGPKQTVFSLACIRPMSPYFTTCGNGFSESWEFALRSEVFQSRKLTEQYVPSFPAANMWAELLASLQDGWSSIQNTTHQLSRTENTTRYMNPAQPGR